MQRASDDIISGVDLFNAVAGVVTIAAAAFAVFVYLDSRRKAAVEVQRASEYRRRLSDLSELVIASAKQVSLLANVADRDDVSKKELKHLAVAVLATLESTQASITSMSYVEARWRFGVPDNYQSPLAKKPTPEPEARS